MKIVDFVIKLFQSLVIAAVLIYFLTGYDSAFEADQSCHAYLSGYNDKSGNYGCDHDIETHQWILFDHTEDTKPATIIKKFRYKFL
tara:strand:+ start:125 stop:382 length:258 start_codon:yes stop_codon:yes gene_type:complete